MKLFKLFVTAFLLSASTAFASAPEGTKSPTTCETVESCITYYSEKYDVPRARLDFIVFGESTYNKEAIGDMDITCKRTGKPVRARGILQLTECYYPHVSDECAFDIKCSLDTAILLIKDEKTCKSQWTTCRRYFNS